MNIRSQYWQIKCVLRQPSVAGSDLLVEVLRHYGIPRQKIAERIDRGKNELIFYVESQRKADQIIVQLKKLKLNGLNFSQQVVQTEDWQNRWKKGIKAFALTKNIFIIPRWVKTPVIKTNRAVIHIDTNMAFGTGLHETTQMMAQLIESQRGDFATFLDIGTGSGILSIVAGLCGAKRITAIDHDPQSITVARKNICANAVSGVKVVLKDYALWAHHQRYDFVAANLVTADLLGFGRKLIRNILPGRYLAVSGISLDNLLRLKRNFLKLPLKPLKTLSGRQWAAVLYQRR